MQTKKIRYSNKNKNIKLMKNETRKHKTAKKYYKVLVCNTINQRNSTRGGKPTNISPEEGLEKIKDIFENMKDMIKYYMVVEPESGKQNTYKKNDDATKDLQGIEQGNYEKALISLKAMKNIYDKDTSIFDFTLVDKYDFDDNGNYILLNAGGKNDSIIPKNTIEYFEDFFEKIKIFIGQSVKIENVSESTGKKDLQKIKDVEKLFNSVFNHDLPDLPRMSNIELLEKMQISLDDNMISQEQYDKIKQALNAPTTAYLKNISSTVLTGAKNIGEWFTSQSDKKSTGKKNNQQTVKLLWFPRTEYKKDPMQKSNKMEYGQFMILIEPQRYTDTMEFFNQTFYGVEDLLTNILDGCPGTTCSNGVSRRRPYKEQIIDITNYQPHFDKLLKDNKNRNKKDDGLPKLTSENLAKINNVNKSKTKVK